MSVPHLYIEASWDKVKACHVEHHNWMNWTDMGTEYKILVEHTPFVYICTITKEDPRSADQADFEDNFKV